MPPEATTLAEYKAQLAKNKAIVLDQIDHVVNKNDLDYLDKRRASAFRRARPRQVRIPATG